MGWEHYSLFRKVLNLTASGVKGASSVIGSAGRGIGSIKQTISDKISSAKSASADNGLGSDIQTPLDA
mgnify:CR=1 FL=1